MSQRFPRSVLRMLVLVGLAASTLVVPTNGPLPGGAEPAAANSAFSDDAHPDVDVNTLDNIPVQTWGVTNEASHLSQTPSLDVEVWDIQQAGTRMFVGGMFLDVQEDRNTTPIRQAYLAAFDVNTGDWISSCRPVFDRTVTLKDTWAKLQKQGRQG